MRKMLVLDIDGTCITDNYILTDELRQLIIHIEKRHYVYIATGRSVSDAYCYYKLLNMTNDIICHNGGLIYNPHNGCVSFHLNIEGLSDILRFLLSVRGDYQINNIVLSRFNETYLFSKENEYLKRIIINYNLPHFFVGSSLGNIDEAQRIIISVSPDYREKLRTEIENRFSNIIICGWRARKDIIDISVGNVNKWFAIEKTAKKNSISNRDIIVFGDACNDIEMLKKAGIGICMCNGNEQAKMIADYITDFDNNGNGVYYFLKNNLENLFDVVI